MNEWEALIRKARDAGLSPAEVRLFIRKLSENKKRKEGEVGRDREPTNEGESEQSYRNGS